MADETSSVKEEAGKEGKFTSVLLDGDSQVKKEKKERKPRRILHFSDGILEEYSTDEEEDEKSKPVKEIVDTRMLAWGPWFQHYGYRTFRKIFKTADFMGGKLAWFFGITTPKYRFEIEEYKRRQREKEEDAAEERRQAERRTPLATVDVMQTSPVGVEASGDSKNESDKY